MPRFPYMNFPFPFYKSYPRTPTKFYNFANTQKSNTQTTSSVTLSSARPSFTTDTNFSDTTVSDSNINDTYRGFEHKNKSNKNDDTFLFDLFGLKIYNDDVLLVSLIYFLYSEGVKDDGLFLVLILLLLS